jgi:hypothetical protein
MNSSLAYIQVSKLTGVQKNGSFSTEFIPNEFLITNLWFLRHQGPGAYASDAPQPLGLLCDPYNPPVLDVPTVAARCLHVHMTREIEAAKGGTYGRE